MQMAERFERILALHCAPTLLGNKPGSLISYRKEPGECLDSLIESYNRELNPNGIYFMILYEREGSALIYIYRRQLLEEILKDPELLRFLRKYCYGGAGTLEGMLEKLRERVSHCRIFPHEIGLFLGYPLADVAGFIENRGQNYQLCGYWKVYSDQKAARRLFEDYSRCSEFLKAHVEKGYPVAQLARAL